MKQVTFSSHFKRDYKKRRREKDLDFLLEDILGKISEGKSSLPVKLHDHPLKGSYAGCRECHLKPDLLLIYMLTTTEVHLIRLGSHSELFS